MSTEEWLEVDFRGRKYQAVCSPSGCLHLRLDGKILRSWYPELVWNPGMYDGLVRTDLILAWCRSYLLNTSDANRHVIAETAVRDVETPLDIVELADQLGDMYPTHDSIVTAVRSVGGKPGRVRWASCGADTWRSILQAAENGIAGIDGEWVRASDYARLLEVK